MKIGQATFKYDPKFAVAWCKNRQKAWVKVDAEKHRPTFKEAKWWSGGKFKVAGDVTMIYYYRHDDQGETADAVRDVEEETRDPKENNEFTLRKKREKKEKREREAAAKTKRD